MHKDYTFYVYFLTNPTKKVLYIGMTNSLERRLAEHQENRGNPKTFAGKNYCYLLVYYEVYQYVAEAIARENQLKKWSRSKKEALIATRNPRWNCLNLNFMNLDS